MLTGLLTGLRKTRAAVLGGLIAGMVLAGAVTVDLQAQGPFSAQIQAALRVFLATAHTWVGVQTHTISGIGVTSTDGITLSNTTAATVGTPVQMSPRYKACGTAYNSVSTLSETDCMFWEVLPATVAGTTTQTWKLGSTINGGAAAYPFTIQSNGAVTATQFTGNMLGQFFSVQNQLIAAPASAQLVIVRPDATVGSVVNVSALPTIASGFGTSPSITAGSTPFAGSVNVGTGGAAATGVINFNGTAFPSAPFCVAMGGNGTGTYSISATTTQLNLANTVAWPASTLVNWICVSSK